jgi:hypothetical protein
MPLELTPISGQPGLFRQVGLGDTIPGTEAAKLINRRATLRKNWMKLRGQLGRGLGAPPAGISKALNDAALSAFNAFLTWDDGIGTVKEVLGAYESEVVDQESIYDMYSTKVAKALQSVSTQPTFTTGIPRASAEKPAPAPVDHASMLPYETPDAGKWGVVDYVLAGVAALAFLYIVTDFQKPRWFDEEVDIPEVKPARGRGQYRPQESELRFENRSRPGRWETPEDEDVYEPEPRRAYSPQPDLEP